MPHILKLIITIALMLGFLIYPIVAFFRRPRQKGVLIKTTLISLGLLIAAWLMLRYTFPNAGKPRPQPVRQDTATEYAPEPETRIQDLRDSLSMSAPNP